MILRLNQWILAVCCCAFLAAPAIAQKGGTSTEPVVKYTIKWMGNPFNLNDFVSGGYNVCDMNNNGQVVGQVDFENGSRSAFVYTVDSGIIVLDILPAMEPLHTAGWTTSIAVAINESGQMAVRMQRTVSGVETKGLFRYDPPSLDYPDGVFVPIQEAGVGVISAINKWGDIAFSSYPLAGGSYDTAGIASWRLFVDGVISTPLMGGVPIPGTIVNDLNDLGQIVGVSNGNLVRYDSLSGTSLVLGQTGSDKAGIINLGEVAFSINVPKGRGVQTKPARFSNGALQILRDVGMATDINSAGDVCGRGGNGVSLLVFPRQGGTVVVDSEVTGTVADVNKWKSIANFQSMVINDRDSTGFGQVCGEAWVPNGTGSYRSELYLLTPK